MPSPFPGMDPYLEAPDLWPDFHNPFAGEIRKELNRELSGRRGTPYYARIEMRSEIGIVGGEEVSRIIPDLSVLRRPRKSAAEGGVALAEPVDLGFSPSVEIALRRESFRHTFVEIRDPTRGHKIVTLIEILSPSNKRRGPDRRAYEVKREEILESDVSLVEIDLLRAGERVLSRAELEVTVELIDPSPDYLVLISRGWRREVYEVFPNRIRDRLPRVPIPLGEGEAELPLDLQIVFQSTYDGGPYRLGAIDYDKPPVPPLSAEDAAWAEGLLKRNPA